MRHKRQRYPKANQNSSTLISEELKMPVGPFKKTKNLISATPAKIVTVTPARTVPLLVRKYRPRRIADIVGNKPIMTQITRYLNSLQVPNLVFSGPFGCGKTTTAFCIANELYGKYAPVAIKHLRGQAVGKETVLNEISHFAIGGFLWSHKVKVDYRLCIIDECDYMTQPAESLLRTVMDSSSDSLRFILTTNNIDKEHLKALTTSRCVSLQFQKISRSDILARLTQIALIENIAVSQQELDDFAKKAEGDLRAALGLLQGKI